jgi:ribosomal protein L37E
MASNLAAVVRLTTRQNAAWRECDGCGKPASLRFDQTRCASCVTPAAKRRRVA